MSEAKYCEDCKRIIGIGCNCEEDFGDKIRNMNLCHTKWGPGRNG